MMALYANTVSTFLMIVRTGQLCFGQRTVRLKNAGAVVGGIDLRGYPPEANPYPQNRRPSANFSNSA